MWERGEGGTLILEADIAAEVVTSLEPPWVVNLWDESSDLLTGTDSVGDLVDEGGKRGLGESDGGSSVVVTAGDEGGSETWVSLITGLRGDGATSTLSDSKAEETRGAKAARFLFFALMLPPFLLSVTDS